MPIGILRFLLFRFVPALIFCLLCACGPQKEPPWSASNIHMTVPAPGQNRAAVYLKLENHTSADRHIHHLSTPIAGTAEIHRHIYEDGMMKMRPVAHALIPARSALVFEPGGYHIMLIDLVETPVAGTRFPLTLEFDAGERLEIEVEVRAR